MTRDKAFAEARKKWPFHPLADCWPPIDEKDWPALVEDIRAHGQQQAILTYDGQILDGRNRLAACLAVGLEPRFQAVRPDTDPLVKVISLNEKRRHQSAADRAVSVATAVAWAKNQVSRQSGGKPPSGEKGGRPATSDSAQVAAVADVPKRTAERAVRVVAKAPEKAAEINAGKKTLHQAEREIIAEKKAKQPKPKKTRAFVELAEAIVQVQQAGRAFRKAAGRGHRLITLTRRLEAFEAEVEKVRTWHPQKGTKCKHCGGRGTVPVSNGGRMECEQCLSGVAGV